ncbi:MAG: hypothetical protein ACI87A_003128, partial [Planctomycetota bacterium]
HDWSVWNDSYFGTNSDLRRFGQAMAARGGKVAKRRAVVAVARKLSVLLHRLWVTGEVYEPLRTAKRSEAKRRVGTPSQVPVLDKHAVLVSVTAG